MKHDLALFDFDGTLADSLPWFAQAMHQLAAEHRFTPIPPEKLMSYRNADASSLIKAFDIPLWRVPRLVTAMRRLMAAEIHRIRLFDGIERFCQRAQAHGLRLGMVSSNSEENVRAALGPANAALFTCFHCGASMLGKAAKLRRAARSARTPVDRSIYIGDELRDLDAAEAAGMPFGGVTWGWVDAAGFARRQPRAVFQTVAEMEDYLLDGNSAANAPGRQ